MSRKKMPTTSLDAYKSLQPDQVRAIYSKIIDALKVLGMASTEQIALHLTLEHAKVNKRVSEMEKLEMIYRPGTRVPTKSGRTAYQWCLRNNQPITNKSEKALPGKGISDFSKEILKNKPGSHQAALFIDSI
jgi:predicted transcriptional regulator